MPNIKQLAEELKKKNGFVLTPPTAYSSFLAEEFPPIPYLVDKLIIKNAINVLVGYAGCGKTFVTMEFAIQVASGGKAFGIYQCDKVPVLIVNEQDSRRSIHARLRSMPDETDLPIYLHVQNSVKLDNTECVDQLVAEIIQNNIGLVIFDNLTQLHNVNENSASEMQGILDQVKRITSTGAGVILVHHFRKDNGQAGNMDNGAGWRGSGSLFGAVATGTTITKTKDPDNFIIEIEQERNKEGKRLTQIIKVEIKSEGDEDEQNQKLWFEFVGMQNQEVSASYKLQQSICSIIQGKDNMKTKDQIIKSVGMSRPIVDTAIRELLRLGRIRRATYAELDIKLGRGSNTLLFWTTNPDDREQTLNLDESSIPF